MWALLSPYFKDGEADLKTVRLRASLVVQWLRLHVPNARGHSPIPGKGTRFYMSQLRHNAAKIKIKKNFLMFKK